MLLQRLLEFIDEFKLIQRGEKILVAVSGGVDSVVLLDLLVELSSLYDLRLHVIHLDHKIRGADSYDDALFVQELSLKYGLDFTIGRSDARLTERGESLEESARRIRHTFFKRCLETLKADKIALAHTADDQIETILMRILRGTGPAGLCGMRPISPPYIRPLLKTWRSEIEEYALQKGLRYRVDLTNYDLHYLRNHIRHILIPMLKEANPAFKDSLLRLSELMWLERDFIEDLLEEKLKEGKREENKYCFESRILRENKFIFLETLRKAIEKLCRSFYGFSKEDLDRVWRGGQRIYNLPKGIKIKDNGKEICIYFKETNIRQKEDWAINVNIPGITEIPGGIITASYVSYFTKPDSENEAFIDLDKVKLPLLVRNRRKGDKIRPIGMKGTKKLKKLLSEASIPLEERDRIPIIVDSEGDIIWVAGVKLSEKAKIEKDSRNILHLVYTKRGEKGHESFIRENPNSSK